MTSVGRKMAGGALWMVFARLSDKILGLASTLILARLLMPADFGLIAMAMSVVILSEILTSFAFDTALVSTHKPPESHYHTAWTLNVLFMSGAAALIAVMASPAALYFSEPRLVPVVLILGLTLTLQGFENIGIVAFRKEMTFGKEFRFLLGKRLAGLMITLPLAFVFRSYWALVAGIVAIRAAGVGLSYVMHPFRPHWSLKDWRVLIAFSKWLLLNNLINYINTRFADLIIGRLAGPSGLGSYSVAYEISTLPTTELVAPINRAILPGYASYAEDKTKLRQGYLDVLSAIALMSFPAAFGLAAVAEPLVHVMLGPKWLAAIPVIQVIALYGAWTAIDSNSYAVYLAVGKPVIATFLAGMRATMLIPSLIFLTGLHGIVGAALALLIVASIATPIGFLVLFRLLEIQFLSFIKVIWRPVLSALTMFALIRGLDLAPAADDTIGSWSKQLFINVGLGVVSYALTLTALWFLAGRPAGIERLFLSQASNVLQSIRKRS